MRYFYLFFLILFLGCSKKTPIPQEQIFPVKVKSAIKEDIPIFLQAVGHVDSIHKVEIKSRIEGELTGVYFKQGAFVKQGDLLFTIDPKPYEAKLKEAKATLEENIVNLKFAKDKVLRYTSLVQEEYFSEIDFERLKTTSESFDAIVQKNQAQVDDAKINLDYCWIYSPINGRTGILKIDQGNLIKASSAEAMITVQQICPIFVTFSLPEKTFSSIQKRKDLKVIVSLDDFEKDVFEGNLFMVDNMVDEKTGMIKLRGIFDNERQILWPGLFVRTRLILEVQKDAILVPAEAIEYTQQGPIVYVVKEGHIAEKRSVELGQREKGNIIIRTGIKENEQVVVEGLVNLFPNAKVKILSKKESSNESF